MPRARIALLAIAALTVAACAGKKTPIVGRPDAARSDIASSDSPITDEGTGDDGTPEDEAGIAPDGGVDDDAGLADAVEGDAFAADAADADAVAQDASPSDARISDANNADSGAVDAGISDARISDANNADSGAADAVISDANNQDAVSLDSGDAGPSDTGAADADPLAALSDDFNGTTLDPSWMLHHASQFTYVVGGGQLTVTPTISLWLDSSSGPMIFKVVPGDFKVTAPVHARRASDPTMDVDRDIQFAGIIARDPASDLTSGQENYVFVVVGHYLTGLATEMKSTVNGTSVYSDPAWPSGDAELRICRLGSDFHLYRRAIGATTWSPLASITRSYLPSPLEVGMLAYARSVIDLAAEIDRVTFASVSVPADCTAD